MSFFNLNNFDCLILNGVTTRFITNEQTKWINVILYIEKITGDSLGDTPRTKEEPDRGAVTDYSPRKYVAGEGISIFRRERHKFILTGYCENSKFGLHFNLNKKYKRLDASINYQGFLKGNNLELVCNEAAGYLHIDRSL